jgi:hypothetical protein
MIPANSRLCFSSRNIKEFQRDLRFSHSLNGFIHHSSKIDFAFYRRRKKRVMSNHQTQLFLIHHKSNNFWKRRRVFSKTPPAQHAFCHHSTSLSRSLGHAFSDTNLSMSNMSSKAFYLLQCCHSSSSAFYSCCYLQATAKIAARWR